MFCRCLQILFIAGAASVLITPRPGEAQIGGVLREARDRANQARETLSVARNLRCEVQGVCGTVTQSDLFTPESYESLAVTVVDGTGRFGAEGSRGLAQDAFERRLVTNGFLLAASPSVEVVSSRMARGELDWSEESLRQLKDFIQGIDAVLVIEIRQLDATSCQLPDRSGGTEATVHLTVRWLNADAGDVPWMATHSAEVCGHAFDSVATEALQAASRQLATSMPTRR